MTLVEHLAELRSRLVKSVLAILVGAGVSLAFYNAVFDVLTGPFTTTIRNIAEEQGLDAKIIFDSVAAPFTVPLKIAVFSGVVLAAPVWIYQLWAFIVPGLYRNERRWAATVLLSAAPLFMGGVLLGYWLLPKGLSVILSFTPSAVSNYVNFEGYLSFVLRFLLIFGLGFLLPVFVVLLNAVGFLTGQRLSQSRRWVIFGIFVFAAVATPTGDPVTMLLLAVPMWTLFEISVVICRLNDRRRARLATEPDYAELADDEASPLAVGEPDPADDRPSRLDDDVT